MSKQEKAPSGFPREIPRPSMLKWETIGSTVRGRFLGLQKPAGFSSPIGKVRKEDGGIVSFSAPSLLALQLEGIEPGTKVYIEYYEDEDTGEKGEDGKPFMLKVFKVFTE